MDTVLPAIEPERGPLSGPPGVVADQVPDKFVPDCAIVACAGRDPGASEFVLLPTHVPATEIAVGDVGEPPHALSNASSATPRTPVQDPKLALRLKLIMSIHLATY